MFRDDLLAQKVCVITGGGSGLGLAMAKRFRALGAKMIILGRSLEKLEAAQKEIEAQPGQPVSVFSCDVKNQEDVLRAADFVLNGFGEADILVNNAAGNFLCASEDLSANAFKSVIEGVLVGTFYCTQAFGKQMIHSKKGSILNIVTTYADSGAAFVLPSACAKAGVAAMTRSLAVEWATYGVRVNAIAPGFFPTQGAWSRLVPPSMKFEERLLQRIPAKRLGSVEELSNLAAYLVADESAYITGEVVTMDGGESLVDSMFQEIAGMDREKLKQSFSALKPKK